MTAAGLRKLALRPSADIRVMKPNVSCASEGYRLSSASIYYRGATMGG